jgi:peptide/nickel transport system ATP-binding protein
VRVDGIDLAELTDAELSGLRSHRIGFVFQDFFLIEGLDATANVAEALIYRGTPRRRRLAEAAEVLDRVGLGHRLDHRPDQLSGGERQRVAIARALAAEPDLLVCDEITSALDVSVQGSIVALLENLRKTRRISMLFVTHNLALVRSIAARVQVLNAGRLVESGFVVEVLDTPRDDYTKRLLANSPAVN